MHEPYDPSSAETADAVLAAGESVTGEQISTIASHHEADTRAVIAVTLAGIGVFLNLYATQPLLPLFEQIFHASKSEVGRTVSAATLGVALSAPFCGALAERVGRRKVIVLSIFLLALPTILAATASGLSQLVFWRFLQGLVMPGIFGVTIAYIAEEWPRHRVPQVMSIYVSGTVLGGFLGRIITGVAATSSSHSVRLRPVGAMVLSPSPPSTSSSVFSFWRWLPHDSPLSAGAHEETSCHSAPP